MRHIRDPALAVIAVVEALGVRLCHPVLELALDFFGTNWQEPINRELETPLELGCSLVPLVGSFSLHYRIPDSMQNPPHLSMSEDIKLGGYTDSSLLFICLWRN